MRSKFISATLVVLFLSADHFVLNAQDPDTPRKTRRIALISKDGSDSSKSLLDLAQVELSNEKRIELLERQAIDRVLTEQKLSLSGLVDANTAVKIGKLLKVDLFAILETAGTKNEAFAIIVYDAATGLRYIDQALPEQGLSERARAVAEATQAAVDKYEKGLKGLKTLSVMAVRNAELPRDRDTTFRSLAMILERQILGSPSVAMLERKRLESLNKEKLLTTEANTQQLLTSVMVMDLEFGKVKTGKGLKATAILSDGAGKELYRETVEGMESNGADVIDPLLKGLLKFLKESPAPKPVDRVREANRFVREGEIAWSHTDRVPAIEAMEAGYALDPANVETRAKLAVYLGEHGARTLNPLRTTYWGNRPAIRAKSEDVNLALRNSIRAIQIFTDDLAQAKEFTARSIGMIENRYFMLQYTNFINNLDYLDERDVDEEGRTLREEFIEAYIQLIQAETRAWAEVLKKDPTQFGQFSLRLQKHNPRSMADGSKIVGRILKPVSKNWLELSRMPGVVFDLPNLPYHLPAMIPRRPEFIEFFEEMCKHPHPVFQLHGMIGVLILEGTKKKFGPADYSPAYQQFKAAAKKAIEDAEKKYPPGTREWIQAACYRVWYDSRIYIKWESGSQQSQEAFDLCDFMLSHKHIVREVLVPQVDSGFPNDPFLEQRFRLVERALEVIDLPENQKNLFMATAKSELLDRKNKLLAAHPELRTAASTAALPWTEVKNIFTTEKFPNLVGLRRALIADGVLYATVLGQKDNKNFVQIVRVELPDGKAELLGKAEFAYVEPSRGFMREDSSVLTDMCITKDKVYVATFAWGIIEFDREGKSPGRAITAKLELPSSKIQSCIGINGKVYAALEGGYLVEIDPVAQTFETIASSRRKETLSPFDDGEAFKIPYIFADPQRDRILFILYQRPDFIYYPPNTKNARTPTNGFWEYNYKTKKFINQLDLFKEPLNRGTLLDDGRLLLGCHRSAITSSSAIAFNLATNQSELLWSGYSPGPTMPRDSARSREVYQTVGTPALLRNGWIWTYSTFGRFSLDTGKQELFPLILNKPTPSSIFSSEFLLSPLADQLVVGDYTGIWLVNLKPEGPIPAIAPIKEGTLELPDEVQSVAISSDGKRALAGDKAGNLRVWSLITHKTELSIAGKNNAVTATAFSSDDQLFAVGFADGSIMVYGAEELTAIQRLPKQNAAVNRVVFSPDGKRIAAGYADNDIVIWDALRPVETARCKGHLKGVTALGFSADGKHLFSGSQDRTIRLWDPLTGKIERAFPDQKAAIVQMKLIEQGKSLLSLGDDKIIRVWDIESGKERRMIPTQGDSVVDFAVSPDEKRIATASREQRLRIWDLVSGIELRQTHAHSRPVTCLAFTSDGRNVLTGGEDHKTMLWKLPADLVVMPKDTIKPKQ